MSVSNEIIVTKLLTIKDMFGLLVILWFTTTFVAILVMALDVIILDDSRVR